MSKSGDCGPTPSNAASINNFWAQPIERFFKLHHPIISPPTRPKTSGSSSSTSSSSPSFPSSPFIPNYTLKSSFPNSQQTTLAELIHANMRTSIVLAIAASLSTASAALQGFNYGSTKTDGSFMYEADFQSKFTTAQNLVGDFGLQQCSFVYHDRRLTRSFRRTPLTTSQQGGSSTNEPTQAIQAAINTKTSLLLGLWASGGEGVIQGEISALKNRHFQIW